MSEFKVDGVDHIRIHSRAATGLGMMLSEFTVRSFRVPKYGEFRHLLGYILYLKTGMKYSEFRYLTPHKCLEFVKTVSTVWNPDYNKDLLAGVKAFVYSDGMLMDDLAKSTLPILSYRQVPGDLMEASEIANAYTEIREHLQQVSFE